VRPLRCTALVKLSTCCALITLLTSCVCFAQYERYDHRGSVGLLVGLSNEYRQTLSPALLERTPAANLGASMAVGVDGNELTLNTRLNWLVNGVDASATVGYRGYFGLERFKSFYEAGWAVHAYPAFLTGPRLGFGFQYELTQVVGGFVGIAAKGAFGAAVRFSAEAFCGVQFRSYLLE
jgi:hypothetical protein